METAGDILDEIDKIQITIRDLTDMYVQAEEKNKTLENAILLLSQYRRTLRGLPIKNVGGRNV